MVLEDYQVLLGLPSVLPNVRVEVVMPPAVPVGPPDGCGGGGGMTCVMGWD